MVRKHIGTLLNSTVHKKGEGSTETASRTETGVLFSLMLQGSQKWLPYSVSIVISHPARILCVFGRRRLGDDPQEQS